MRFAPAKLMFVGIVILSMICAAPSYAIVVVAPLVAVSAIKLALFIVSVLAIPLAFLIRLFHFPKHKMVWLTIGILLLIFVVTYLVLKVGGSNLSAGLFI